MRTPAVPLCGRYPPAHYGAAALPAGWIAQADPATGHPFFVDTATGVSHWSLPIAAAAPTAAPAAAPELPTGWTAHVDPSSGTAYFVHAASGKSQWTAPSVGGSDGASKETAGAAAADSERAAPGTAATGEAAAASSDAAAREKEGTLPTGWVTVVDPVSGRTYYFESASGTSQWDMPSAEGSGEPALKKRAVLTADSAVIAQAEAADSDSDANARPPGVDEESLPLAATGTVSPDELRHKLPSKSNEPEVENSA